MDEAQELGLEVIEPRSVAELLTLETYQGMTDVEIESLIDYKIKIALIDDERDQIIKAKIDEQKIELQILAEAQAYAQSTLEKRVGIPLELRTVKDNDA